MSDPKRTPDIVGLAAKLPKGAGLIYRHFGRAERFSQAKALRRITFTRGQTLLIGADPELAIEIGADGVHFRRDADLREAKLWRQRCPDWIITMAGLKTDDSLNTGYLKTIYKGDLSVLDGLFVSAIFPSQSPSAGPAIGLDGLKAHIRALDVPIFALGGANSQTAHSLIGSGAAGLAGISGLV